MRSSARFLAIVNLVSVIYSVVFYIPARAVSSRIIERALISGDVKEIKFWLEFLLSAQSDNKMLFTVCFVLLIANCIFLWRLTKVSNSPSPPVSN